MDKRYVFPVLKVGEIVVCMKELGLAFTEEDVLKPTPARAIAAYEVILDALIGLAREETEANLHAMAHEISYFEIYSDSLATMAFHQQFAKLMSQVGIVDYSLRDLHRPEPQRVRRILSACLNLLKFREERMPIYEELTQRSDEYVDQYQTLLEQHGELTQKLEHLQLQREHQEPKIKHYKEHNNALTQALRELKREQTALMSDVDELKREKQEAAQRLANCQYMTVNLRQEIAKTRGRIVHSPEKLKEIIEGMGRSLGEDKDEFLALEKQSRDLQARINAVGSVESDLQACIAHMEECEVELARVADATKRNNRNKEMVEQKQIEVREVEVRDTQLNRQIANARDKLARAQRQLEAKRESSQKRMDQIKEEYAAIARDRVAKTHEMEKKKAYIAQTEKKIADLRESLNAQALAVQTEYAHLKTHVDVYMKEMQKSMQMAA